MNSQTAQSKDASQKRKKWSNLRNAYKAINENYSLKFLIDLWRWYIPLALILIGLTVTTD